MSTRLIAIVSAAAFLAATPAFAQTLQRAPGRVAVPDRQATTQEQQAPMVAERTTTNANAALNQQMDLARPEMKLFKVTCNSVVKTRFAYQLWCKELLSADPSVHFVFRRDGTQPWWAMKGEDFPEIEADLMNAHAGNANIFSGPERGTRIFYIYADPASDAGRKYCETEHALAAPGGDAPRWHPPCHDVFGFAYRINEESLTHARERN